MIPLKYSSHSRASTAESNKAKHIQELRDEMEGDDAQAKKKLYQRGLGLFHKLVVGETKVLCTCENYCRFGKCQDSKLLSFICNSEKGHLDQKHAINCIESREGFCVLAQRLLTKVLNLVETGTVDIEAPPQDPSKVVQDAKR